MEKINYKIDKINVMLYELQKLSKTKKLTIEQVYLQITNNGITNKENISNEISLIIEKYNKNKKICINVNDKGIELTNNENKKTTEYNTYLIELNISLRKENIVKTVTKIIDYLTKTKIEYQIKLYNELDNFLKIKLYNKKDAEKVALYINNTKDISENINEENPLYFNDGKISLDIISPSTISYQDVLIKYIYKYIMICNENNKIAEYEGFIHFLDLNIIDFINKDNLSEQISLLDDKKNISESLNFLEEITSLIYTNLKNLKENKDIKDIFYKRYEELNNIDYINIKKDKYIDFNLDNFNKDKDLLRKIIETMSYKYGYDHTKEALRNYRKTGKINYITEKNTKERMYKVADINSFITNEKKLREKVKKSKTFKTFINSYDDNEFEKLFNKLKPEIDNNSKETIKTTKEMVLENICKETYLYCIEKENNCDAKTQVAISLIKLKNNNYNYITRNNDARDIAKKHIKPEEVIDIIKKSLETNGYIIEKEEDLYELYANHIKYLCNEK